MPTIRIQPNPFDAAAEVALLTAGRTDIGAVVTFTGLCRAEGKKPGQGGERGGTTRAPSRAHHSEGRRMVRTRRVWLGSSCASDPYS